MYIYEKEKKIVTQIGSLPYTDIEKAVEYSLKHDIPFLPELTALGDSMLEYAKNPGKLSCLKKFKEIKYETVKVQCVGPVTLMMAGFNENEAQYTIMTHVSSILDGLNAEEIILFLDEPALGQTGIDYNKHWDLIFSEFNTIKGVHICGNMQFDHLFKFSNIDIISFDASSYDITLYGNERNGKKVAWGIKNSKDIKNFVSGDLITLPCGMSDKIFNETDCEGELEMMIQSAFSHKQS